jgi:hypothetical protein
MVDMDAVVMVLETRDEEVPFRSPHQSRSVQAG